MIVIDSLHFSSTVHTLDISYPFIHLSMISYDQRRAFIFIEPSNMFSFNLSASVVKEQGMYWEGISVTLGCKLLMLQIVLIHCKKL